MERDTSGDSWDEAYNERVEILAKRYRGKELSSEEKLRLAELTEELFKLLPRVDDFDDERAFWQEDDQTNKGRHGASPERNSA